jgi:hypothetical protein
MLSPARRRLISVAMALALLYGAAILAAKGVNLKWLLVPLMFPGLKAALLFFPGGMHGANANTYLKVSILLNFLLLCVVIESIWIAAIKLRTRRLDNE